MTYDYYKEDRVPMRLDLEGGKTVTGEFLEMRITAATIPEGMQWYQLRHFDDDWTTPASLKHGCVAVNFLGTFICEPIEGLSPGDEVTVKTFKRL